MTRAPLCKKAGKASLSTKLLAREQFFTSGALAAVVSYSYHPLLGDKITLALRCTPHRPKIVSVD